MDQQAEFTPVFLTRSPHYLWVADRPLAPDVIPQKLDLTQIKEKFGFDYCENIFVPPHLPYSFEQRLPRSGMERELFYGLRQSLQTPLNDKLAVCYIDSAKTYGLFARALIPAGTVIGIYGGEVSLKTNEFTHGIDLMDSLYRIDASKRGGIARFIQHMPCSVEANQAAIKSKTGNFDELIGALGANGVCFSGALLPEAKKEFRRNPAFAERFLNDNLGLIWATKLPLFKPESPEVSVANVQSFLCVYNGHPITYLAATMDIQPYKQLGCPLEKGTTLQYFHQETGEVLSKNHRHSI